MNASCLDEKGRFKSCPYRVYTDEHKAILRGQGDFVSQCFYPCIVRGALHTMWEFAYALPPR